MEGSIMVVDDMEIALDLMKTFLNRADFQNVSTYDNPLLALHDIEQGLCPDLIITDFRMPGMNGIQFLDAVSTVYSGIPAIIITGAPDLIKSIPDNCKILEKGGTNFFKTLISLVKDFEQKPQWKERLSHNDLKLNVKKEKIFQP